MPSESSEPRSVSLDLDQFVKVAEEARAGGSGRGIGGWRFNYWQDVPVLVAEVRRLREAARLVVDQVGGTLRWAEENVPGTNLRSDILLIEHLEKVLTPDA